MNRFGQGTSYSVQSPSFGGGFHANANGGFGPGQTGTTPGGPAPYAGGDRLLGGGRFALGGPSAVPDSVMREAQARQGRAYPAAWQRYMGPGGAAGGSLGQPPAQPGQPAGGGPAQPGQGGQGDLLRMLQGLFGGGGLNFGG